MARSPSRRPCLRDAVVGQAYSQWLLAIDSGGGHYKPFIALVRKPSAVFCDGHPKADYLPRRSSAL